MLTLAMERAKALELLEDAEHCSKLTMGQFHDLLVRAGFSPDAAQKQASQHGWDRLSAGVTM